MNSLPRPYNEVLQQALERIKTLTPESYEVFARKLQEQDKTLVYNDSEMEEYESFSK